ADASASPRLSQALRLTSDRRQARLGEGARVGKWRLVTRLELRPLPMASAQFSPAARNRARHPSDEGDRYGSVDQSLSHFRLPPSSARPTISYAIPEFRTSEYFSDH